MGRNDRTHPWQDLAATLALYGVLALYWQWRDPASWLRRNIDYYRRQALERWTFATEAAEGIAELPETEH